MSVVPQIMHTHLLGGPLTRHIHFTPASLEHLDEDAVRDQISQLADQIASRKLDLSALDGVPFDKYCCVQKKHDPIS